MTNQNGTSLGTKIMAAFILTAVLALATAIFSVIGGSGVLAIIACVFSVVIFIVSIVCAICIPKSITSKINNVSKKLSDFANGNYSVSFRTNDNADIDVLSNKIADVTETLSNVIADVSDVAKKVENGYVDVSVNENLYPTKFKNIANNLNYALNELTEETKSIAETFKGYISGDYKKGSIVFKGEKAAFNNIVPETENQEEFFNDISKSIKAANEGDFSKLIPEDKYTGHFNLFASKTNMLLNSVNVATNELLEVFTEIAQSNNFKTNIEGEYKGVFAEIKNQVNSAMGVVRECLSGMVEAFIKMSEKNLDVSLSYDFKGDFANMKNYIEIAVENFNELFVDLEKSAKKLTRESKNICDTSKEFSAKTVRQTVAIDKLNNSISKLAVQAIENEKSTLEANKIAVSAKESASIGNTQMNEMLSAMNDINDASKSISNIIKVIEDIAFQTNILALNAAVEAARAGEHGKGFAVVADEVRTLASRSQQAANETTELIESSIEKISDGSEIAHSTAQSLAEIIDKINNISSIIEKTSKISSEQGSEIKSLQEGINEIDSAARDISEASKSEAAYNSLERNASDLMSKIASFTIKSKDDIEKSKQMRKENFGEFDITDNFNLSDFESEILTTQTKEENTNVEIKNEIPKVTPKVSEPTNNVNSAIKFKEKAEPKFNADKKENTTINVNNNRETSPLNITSQDGIRHIPEGEEIPKSVSAFNITPKPSNVNVQSVGANDNNNSNKSGNIDLASFQAIAAAVPKASATVGSEIPVIDFESTRDFGKY